MGTAVVVVALGGDTMAALSNVGESHEESGVELRALNMLSMFATNGMILALNMLKNIIGHLFIINLPYDCNFYFW